MVTLTNTSVNHVTLGKGTIISSTPSSITVRFPNREIKMNYPMAFDKYLSMEGGELSNKIQQDLALAKAEIAAREEAEKDKFREILAGIDVEKAKKTDKLRKSDLIQAFDNTVDFCEDDDTLRPACRETISKQKIFISEKEILKSQSKDGETTDSQLEDSTILLDEDVIILDRLDLEKSSEIIVSKENVLTCAAKHKDKKTCILNFTSDLNPEQKAREGSTSVNNSLLRTTTLYKSLIQNSCWKNFYEPHRKSGNSLYDNRAIYSPDVIVFKSDMEIPKLMNEEDWFKVDIITTAPPVVHKISTDIVKPENSDRTELEGNENNGKSSKKKEKTKEDRFTYEGNNEGIKTEELEEVITDRICQAFAAAHYVGAEALVISSWGCEKNHNPRKLVAKCFKKAVGLYQSRFDVIEFSLPPVSGKTTDYETFKKSFE